jgi:hypothetical protein
VSPGAMKVAMQVMEGSSTHTHRIRAASRLVIRLLAPPVTRVAVVEAKLGHHWSQVLLVAEIQWRMSASSCAPPHGL